MITKLKQGLGRLIRKKDDFGVVTIIDKRAHLNEKKYSSEVHEAI